MGYSYRRGKDIPPGLRARRESRRWGREAWRVDFRTFKPVLPASIEGRRFCGRAVRVGAFRSSGASPPYTRGNSDLPRKPGPLRRPCFAWAWWQERANSDPVRKEIVTSHARSNGTDQFTPDGHQNVRPDLVCVFPANSHIDPELGGTEGRSRGGCGKYRPPTQAIVTYHASNSDPSYKVIVTCRARNSDPARKVIVTCRASNSDPARKDTTKKSCKTAYFANSGLAPLLYVCMFDVTDVYRKEGGGWA